MADYEFKQRLADHLRQHFAEEKNTALETVFRFLLLPRFDAGALISAGALAELEIEGAGTPGVRALYFLVPTAGGLVTSLEGRPVQVITDHSPLGAALLGRGVGDIAEVEVRGQVRRYRVLSIC